VEKIALQIILGDNIIEQKIRGVGYGEEEKGKDKG
jgi:hypothetical protein